MIFGYVMALVFFIAGRTELVGTVPESELPIIGLLTFERAQNSRTVRYCILP